MNSKILAPFQKGDKVEIKDTSGMRRKGTRAIVILVGYDTSGNSPSPWRVKIHFDGDKSAHGFWWSTAWFKKIKA